MKNNLVIISIGIVLGFLAYSFSYDSSPVYVESSTEKVSLKLKGTGSKRITVRVGVGTSVGNCARGCYKKIGPNTTVSIQANVGDVIWDADKKTTILKVSSGMDGDVIDLKNYY